MPRGRKNKSGDYKDDMKQSWSPFGHGYYDQFGFEIFRGEKYKLYWKEKFITDTNTLQAAKEISLVLINDRIMHA